jgi:hypothetical protein
VVARITRRRGSETQADAVRDVHDSALPASRQLEGMFRLRDVANWASIPLIQAEERMADEEEEEEEEDPRILSRVD